MNFLFLIFLIFNYLIALLVLLAVVYHTKSREYSTKYISDEGYGSIESTIEESDTFILDDISPAWLHLQNQEIPNNFICNEREEE